MECSRVLLAGTASLVRSEMQARRPTFVSAHRLLISERWCEGAARIFKATLCRRGLKFSISFPHAFGSFGAWCGRTVGVRKPGAFGRGFLPARPCPASHGRGDLPWDSMGAFCRARLFSGACLMFVFS